MGVAVVFDESDEENGEEGGGQDGNSDVEEDEVVDIAESSSEEEDNDNEEEDKNGEAAVVAEEEADGEEKMVQGGRDEKEQHGKKNKSSNNRILTVHEIDAHYLQRQLSKHYDDADVCAKISDDVLSVLDITTKITKDQSSSTSDVRECENKLLVLLGFELFDLIKLVLTNRVRIWGCVKLKRAKDDAERDEIERVLREEETGEGRRVWEELHSKSKAEDWTRERMRGITETLQKKKEDKKSVSKALDSIG
eukprot:14098617-Ditylum_brightwellii.AAC.1